MKTLFLTLAILFGAFTLNAQDRVILNTEVKNQIVAQFDNFEGEVTQAKIDVLLTSLSDLSSESTDMCFTSLGKYNNCAEGARDVYATFSGYIDDLIGKNVTVELIGWNKPWEDENFYTLKFKISYDNHNPDFPVDINFDTVILDINNDKIKNITYGREWIDLATFGQ